MTSDLLARLESAPVGKQKPVITAALAYAAEKGWIDSDDFSWAMACVDIGAFLDAARTLVPEGWGWIIGDDGSAQILEPDWRQNPSDRGIGDASANAATPALALCIAALKAREKTE